MKPPPNPYANLSESDKLSIDLVLESRLAPGASSDIRRAGTGADVPLLNTPLTPQVETIERWYRILSNLDHFEVPEPPNDLVERTLDRIDEARFSSPADFSDLDTHLSPNLSH
jgi:hypothetical protein